METLPGKGRRGGVIILYCRQVPRVNIFDGVFSDMEGCSAGNFGASMALSFEHEELSVDS